MKVIPTKMRCYYKHFPMGLEGRVLMVFGFFDCLGTIKIIF